MVMGKYDPLKHFLEAQPDERVPMTFSEIERLVGAPLPKSKRYAAWWSNNPSNNTMTEVWLEAGFATEQVDPAGETLVFRRVERQAQSSASRAGWLARLQDEMAGTVQVEPGWDLTNPTGEIWDAERE
jgi:hypothetical protein